MTNVTAQQKVEGFYTLLVRDAKTHKIKREVGPFHNKITDIGLNRIGTGPAMTNAYVGTGTTPAAFTDTTMAAFKVASSTAGPGNNTSKAPTLSNPYCSMSYVRRFAAGAISGNITEIGVGWAANPLNALWSRELIVDSGGNPITLTVLANEFLDVVYTIRYYISTTDSAGSFVLNGITYNYTLRTAQLGGAYVDLTAVAGAPFIANFYAAGATLGAITSTPSGTTVSPVASVTYPAYVNNSYTLDCNSAIPLNGGNGTGGISAILLGTGNVVGGTGLFQNWQMLLDKPIPKTASNTMAITFSRTWGRA